MEASFPEAKARLDAGTGPGCWLWVVEQCPYCKKQHTHGGGPRSGDPREYLGHRLSHCASRSERADYVLVELEEKR